MSFLGRSTPAFLILLAACAADPRSSDSASSGDDVDGKMLGGSKSGGAVGAPGVDPTDKGGDCFGVPRAPGELCPVVVVSDELDEPTDVTVREGVAYVASKGGLVRVDGAGIERLVEGSAWGVDSVEIEGDWLVWRTNIDLFRAPLGNLGAAQRIDAPLVRDGLCAHSGRIYFGTGDTDGKGGSLVRVALSNPQGVDLVTPNAETGLVATDGSYLYYVAPGSSTASSYTSELRRVSTGGGDGERIAGVEGHPFAMTVTPEFLFVSTGHLYAVRKTGGAAARKVFDGEKELVTSLTSDSEGVYFVTQTEDATRFYRSSLDGRTVRLLGQSYGSLGGIGSGPIAVDGQVLFATGYQAGHGGKLVKLPKQ